MHCNYNTEFFLLMLIIPTALLKACRYDFNVKIFSLV